MLLQIIDCKRHEIHYIRVADIRKDFVRKVNSLSPQSKDPPIEMKEFLTLIGPSKDAGLDISLVLGEKVPHGWREDELVTFWWDGTAPTSEIRGSVPPK